MANFLGQKSFSNRLILVKQVMLLLSKISVALLVIFSIILLLFNFFKPDVTEQYRVDASGAVSPTSSFFKRQASNVYDLKENVITVLNAYTFDEEIKKLKRENLKLAANLYLEREENRKLKKQLNYIPAEEQKFFTASIISRNPGPFVAAAYIQSKYASKFEKDDIVVNEDGLVGQIESVSGQIANVILITDRRSNVPVKIRNTGRRAILVGNGTSNPELGFLLSTKKIIVGEEILTSGDGGVFPPDIPVGYVEKIENDKVFIATYADWSSLEYVFIYK